MEDKDRVPNEDRGEVGLKLGETQIVLEPSFERLAKLRKAAGGKRLTAYFKDITALMEEREAPVEELALCLLHLSRSPEFKSAEDAADLVSRHGVSEAFTAIGSVISVVLSGKSLEVLDRERKEAEEKAKAEGGTLPN